MRPSTLSKTMATIYDWLEEAGFDFQAGEIIYQSVTEDSYSPGWGDPASAGPMPIEVLHQKFSDGHGSPQCPRFFARCGDFIYFPRQYDGSTSLVKVNVNPSFYLDINHPTPYPGN